ncbi:MAG: hypothetical protein A2086_10150 [Spirochaetes bacterium GWD1_27_9]|nr:MAG: hypothetical protein A2Z98_08045 [Spirochaetes bacterium GWB1_27_13]OHD35791.1 MAG: hypothetical protein A2086_10150 [Spirochaetes bacterium GWD1_27_9]
MDPFIGEIKAIAFNFPPQDYAFCNGQKLPTLQNQALFSLIGTAYGGDNTNFALPDLKGRVPIGATTMGGTQTTSPYPYGNGNPNGGKEALNSGTIVGVLSSTASITLKPENMPQHTHTADISTLNSTGNITINCSSAPATQTTGDQGYLANANTVINRVSNPTNAYNTSTPDKTLKSDAASFSGSIGGSITIQPAGSATPTAINIPINNTASILLSNSSTASVVQPYTIVNYIIAIMGLYPTRP